MDSDHADYDSAKAQLLSANLSALSFINCFPTHDTCQQTYAKKA
jgi:hypothetical protein